MADNSPTNVVDLDEQNLSSMGSEEKTPKAIASNQVGTSKCKGTWTVLDHSEQNQSSLASQEKLPKNITNNVLGMSKCKATWTPKMHAFWVDTCLELVRAQMRPTTHLNSQGYAQLINKFNKEFNVNFTKKQMKNHWDAVKKDWQNWNGLVSDNNHTALGWNRDLGVISAPDDWWESRLKLNPKWAKWRSTPLEHCFKLDEIFQNINVTGKRAWAPSSDHSPSPTKDLIENTDSSGQDLGVGAFNHPKDSEKKGGDGNMIEDNNEETRHVHKVRKLASSNGKETKSSRLTGSQKVLKNMDKMFSALDSRSTASSERLNIGKVDSKRALDAMAAIPGMEVGGDLYLFGADLLVRKEYRDMFLVLPTPELQLAFLQRKYNMSNASNAFHNHISHQPPFAQGSLQWTRTEDAYRPNLLSDRPNQ